VARYKRRGSEDHSACSRQRQVDPLALGLVAAPASDLKFLVAVKDEVDPRLPDDEDACTARYVCAQDAVGVSTIGCMGSELGECGNAPPSTVGT
jgi:hypothetical protein